MDLPKAIFVLFVLFKIFFEIGAIMFVQSVGVNNQVALLLLKNQFIQMKKPKFIRAF
jgi:hypothetical protein